MRMSWAFAIAVAVIACKGSSDDGPSPAKPDQADRADRAGAKKTERDRVREDGPWLSVPLATPTPDPDLPDGTIALKVTGADREPMRDHTIKLDVGGAARRPTTDRDGFAEVRGVAAGSEVSGAAATNASAAVPKFTMPASGGMRVRLSTVEPVGEPLAPARELSGVGYYVDDLPPGTLEVTVAHLGDPTPPDMTEVVLVGYKLDETVSVVRTRTDDKARARFDKLDTSGATTYIPMAPMLRRGIIDRPAGLTIPGKGSGLRMILVAEKRDAATPPIDGKAPSAEPTPVGWVEVMLRGTSPGEIEVDVIDAETGVKLVRGKHPAITEDKPATMKLELALRPGQVVYAEARASGERRRSIPMIAVDGRGLPVMITFGERTGVQFVANLVAEDDAIRAALRFHLQNVSWLPYRMTGVIPLPRGARDVQVEGVEGLVLTDEGLEMRRPLGPGGLEVKVYFELPAVRRTVEWSLELPHGAKASRISVEKLPGVELELPDGVASTTQAARSGTDYEVIEIDEVRPKKSFAFSLRIPPPPADADVRRACKKLGPSRSKLVGKKAPPFELNDARDGAPVKLSSLRGQVALVNFTASFNVGLVEREHPRLIELARKKLGGLAIVMVSSERDKKDLPATARSAPFPVLVDHPPTVDVNVGSVTTSYGIDKVPETYLIDRDGIVRFHIVNWREWDSADAMRCLNALLDEK